MGECFSFHFSHATPTHEEILSILPHIKSRPELRSPPALLTDGPGLVLSSLDWQGLLCTKGPSVRACPSWQACTWGWDWGLGGPWPWIVCTKKLVHTKPLLPSGTRSLGVRLAEEPAYQLPQQWHLTSSLVEGTYTVPRDKVSPGTPLGENLGAPARPPSPVPRAFPFAIVLCFFLINHSCEDYAVLNPPRNHKT